MSSFLSNRTTLAIWYKSAVPCTTLRTEMPSTCNLWEVVPNNFGGNISNPASRLLVAKGHKNTNAPLILKIREIIFFYFGQTT